MSEAKAVYDLQRRGHETVEIGWYIRRDDGLYWWCGWREHPRGYKTLAGAIHISADIVDVEGHSVDIVRMVALPTQVHRFCINGRLVANG